MVRRFVCLSLPFTPYTLPLTIFPYPGKQKTSQGLVSYYLRWMGYQEPKLGTEAEIISRRFIHIPESKKPARGWFLTI